MFGSCSIQEFIHLVFECLGENATYEEQEAFVEEYILNVNHEIEGVNITT